ncbi:MAG: amidohydrolase [Bacteroidaceae bacterium]|nr:amidohydrolase [Bacteroidaceae bacterium]
MGKLIIDAHSHLWLKQDAIVDGKVIKSLPNGRSIFFGEEVQMMPPFIIDSVNSAEVFLSNMNYAQVGAAVVVQEIIDGNQNEYLKDVQHRYPDRFFCMGMALCREEAEQCLNDGLKGIAIPGHRLKSIAQAQPQYFTDKQNPLLSMMTMFKFLEEKGMVLSMCLDDDEQQIAEMKEVIQECPRLKVAIGHFGMPTTASFRSQVGLALAGENVMVESGGITWLYNSEFYPFPTAVKKIREAADMVGMDRLMWGSDYPRTITAITYRMSYDFVEKTTELTEAEKQDFLGGNAMRFYGFHNLPDLPYIKNMSE